MWNAMVLRGGGVNARDTRIANPSHDVGEVNVERNGIAWGVGVNSRGNPGLPRLRPNGYGAPSNRCHDLILPYSFLGHIMLMSFTVSSASKSPPSGPTRQELMMAL